MTQTMLDLGPRQPPLEAPREVVLASAGAGKTFHISSRIIALLAHGEEPEAVLASTFTRKAAGEILRRVLDRMAEAALSPEKAAALAGFTTLSEARPVPPETAFWADQLARVVRVLHRMSVSTLDAFFVGAARTFAHELELPPTWSIADEPTARRLRSEALQRLLDSADEGEIVELLRLVHQGEVRRSVHDLLLDDLDKLLVIQSQLVRGAEDAWAAFEAVDPGGEPPDAAELERLAARFAAVEVPLTKSTGEPRKHWVSNLTKASAAVREGDWAGFLALKLCDRALSDDPVFDRVEITPDVCAMVRDGQTLARRALRPLLARRVRALGRLTEDFARAYRGLQRREGAYRFEDVTRLLGELDPFAGGDALYYRLDARTRHILLDEFQDTSLPQWMALAPLVDEVLQDPGRSGVIVADPKQSIYGWRGGEPALVHDVRERYGLESAVLARSYRSSQVVLDLVNRVFTTIDENPVVARDADCAAAARRWREDFVPHEAHFALPGYVRVEAGPRDPGSGSVRPLLCQHVASRIARIRAEAPEATIGVLTRTNPTVSRLMLELRNLGIPVSGEGGTPLTDSAACEAILALLRLADHPADRIARYHVARSPLGKVVEMTDLDDHTAAARAGRTIRAELVERGYGATLDRLAGEVAGACDARELRRLGQLVELAHRYEGRATLRPADFVRLVESQRVEDPTSAAVRVMTVHQAKGLEFDIVVLPDLDQKLYRAGGSGLPLPWRPSPTAPATAVYPAVKKAYRPLFPEVEEAREQVAAATVRDGLSTFYVALTRAAHAVFVFLREDGKNGPGTTLSPARILREAVAPGVPAVMGEGVYEAGEWEAVARGKGSPVAGRRSPGVRAEGGDAVPAGSEAVRTPALEGAARAEGPPAPGTRRPAPTSPRLRTGKPRTRIFPRRSPSQLEGGSHVRIADLLRLDSGTALDRGSVVHAWFEAIEWIEDGLPPETELRRLARLHGPNVPAGRLDALIQDFRRWTGAPEVRDLLSRRRYPLGATVERESAFVMLEDDSLMEGFIDRLVLIHEGGRVTSAEIVDFKTDQVQGDPEKRARRTAHYTPQIEAYRRAVARMHGIDTSSITATLLFVEEPVAVAM